MKLCCVEAFRRSVCGRVPGLGLTMKYVRGYFGYGFGSVDARDQKNGRCAELQCCQSGFAWLFTEVRRQIPYR